MNKLATLLALTLFLSSCAESFNVQGTTSISRFDGKTAYIRMPGQNGRTTYDSAQINHGEFYFYGDVDSTAFAYLFVGGEEVMPIVLEHGSLSLQVSTVTQRASGTPLNDRLSRFFNERDRIEDKLYSIQQESMELLLAGHSMAEVRHRLGGRQERLLRRMEKLETDFIRANYDNVLGPNVFMLLAARQPVPCMTDQIRTIVRKAPPGFLHHPYVRDYLIRCGQPPR